MVDDDAVDAGTQASGVKRRVERRVAPLVGAAILADVSESMSCRDGAEGATAPRRIDRLARVLDYLLVRVRVQSLVCFSDLPVEVPLVGQVRLPEPAGSTALELALEHVSVLTPRPTRLIVLSDGYPNDDRTALAWARRLAPMVIDAYYVGPDTLDPGREFMRDLAGCGGPGGRSGHFDMLDPLLLGNELHRRLIAGPVS